MPDDKIDLGELSDRELLILAASGVNTLTGQVKKLNGNVVDNTKRSIRNATWINALRWSIGAGAILLGITKGIGIW